MSELCSFLRLNNVALMNISHFVYQSVNRHLSCFYIFTIVNNTSLHTNVQYLFEPLLSILLGINLGVELLDHVEILCLTHEEPLNFSTAAVPILHSYPAVHRGSNFSSASSTFIFLSCAWGDDFLFVVYNR